jgi:hypothetical protein
MAEIDGELGLGALPSAKSSGKPKVWAVRSPLSSEAS